MDHNFFESLINTHAVTGDTDQREDFIKTELDKLKVKYSQDPFGSIYVGNPEEAKVMVAMHLDEVGFQVVAINEDGTLKVLPVGWVFPNRLDHASVYIKINGKRVSGAIFHKDSLKSENVESFAELFCDIGVSSAEEAKKLGIKPGQTGSFKREYWNQEGTIFASGVDNTVSIYTMFQILKESKNTLKDVCFVIHNDEEMQDHSANSVAFQYKPEYVVIMDYCPIHHTPDPEDELPNDQGPFAIYRAGAHIVHKDIRKIVDTTDIPKAFISARTLPSVEPQNFQNNGTTKALNFCIPARGYHGGIYAIREQDLGSFHERVMVLIKKFLNA